MSHEADKFARRPVAIGAVVAVAIVLFGWGLPALMEAPLTKAVEAGRGSVDPIAYGGRQRPPVPRLQVNPDRDIEEHRRREDAILSSYAWIDREQGVVRIPIERAMAAMAENGGNR